MTIEVGPRRYAHESIPVPLLRDRRISYRARGIAGRLLTNAPGYRMTAEDISRESPNEGRTAILTAMKELRRYGYAVVFRTQDEKGHWRTVTRISGWPEWETEPRSGEPTSVEAAPKSDEPTSVEPASRDRAPKSSSSTKRVSQRERTTTTSTDLNWVALPQLSPDDRAEAARIVQKFEPSQQQALLDELAGALRKKTIKSEWPGWLYRIAQKASEGAFQPNHALAIQSERKLRADAEQRAEQQRAEAEARSARLSDPEAKARTQAKLKAIGALLRP